MQRTRAIRSSLMHIKFVFMSSEVTSSTDAAVMSHTVPCYRSAQINFCSGQFGFYLNVFSFGLKCRSDVSQKA